MQQYSPVASVESLTPRSASAESIPDTIVQEDEIDQAMEKSRNVTKAIQEATVISLGGIQKTLETYVEVSNPDIKDYGAAAQGIIDKIDGLCLYTLEVRRHREWFQMQVCAMMLVCLLLSILVLGYGAYIYYLT